MILLASRLGLRGSDIVNLNLNNLDWENNVIRLTQQKTGQEVILPLLTEVGNALAEYLRYVRPQSNIKTVFLSLSPPIRPLINRNFQMYFSGIFSGSRCQIPRKTSRTS